MSQNSCTFFNNIISRFKVTYNPFLPSKYKVSNFSIFYLFVFILYILSWSAENYVKISPGDKMEIYVVGLKFLKGIKEREKDRNKFITSPFTHSISNFSLSFSFKSHEKCVLSFNMYENIHFS